MPTLKLIPWVSLALLLGTYSTLGWLLSAWLVYAFQTPWVGWAIWMIVVVAVLLLAAALSSPWSKLRDSFAHLVKSDTRAFLVAVIFALLSVVIITWLHIFVHILVVVAAGTLVRLDTQTAKWSNKQSFWFLAIASLISLFLGAVARTVLQPHFG